MKTSITYHNGRRRPVYVCSFIDKNHTHWLSTSVFISIIMSRVAIGLVVVLVQTSPHSSWWCASPTSLGLHSPTATVRCNVSISSSTTTAFSILCRSTCKYHVCTAAWIPAIFFIRPVLVHDTATASRLLAPTTGGGFVGGCETEERGAIWMATLFTDEGRSEGEREEGGSKEGGKEGEWMWEGRREETEGGRERNLSAGFTQCLVMNKMYMYTYTHTTPHTCICTQRYHKWWQNKYIMMEAEKEQLKMIHVHIFSHGLLIVGQYSHERGNEGHEVVWTTPVFVILMNVSSFFQQQSSHCNDAIHCRWCILQIPSKQSFVQLWRIWQHNLHCSIWQTTLEHNKVLFALNLMTKLIYFIHAHTYIVYMLYMYVCQIHDVTCICV